MVVYDNHILWHRGDNLYESFCCAILNYYYKHKDALFSNIVKTTQSHIPYVKNSCPDLDDAIEDAFHRLNVLHQYLDSLTEESSQPETSTDGDQPSEVPITPSATEPTMGTDETSDSTEENNLSQEPTNEEQSQLETEDNTQSNDQSETCTIPNDSTLNGLYP